MTTNLSSLAYTINLDDSDQVTSFLRDASLETKSYLRVDHGTDGRHKENLLGMSRRSPDAKSVLTGLASHGFYAYMHVDNETRFVAHDALGRFWQRIRDGQFLQSKEGIVYRYEPPIYNEGAKRLLVIFSSMAADSYMSSLMRYFVQNFSSVQKYVPKNTAVLRIADFGGVIGSFYLNNTNRPRNAESIQRLIEIVAAENFIQKEDIVLYGASKGGSGALYHGIYGKYNFVAVDPIITDDHYVSVHDDFHFTVGPVFDSDKRIVFADLLAQKIAPHQKQPGRESSRQAIIFSERSPVADSVKDVLLSNYSNSFAFLNSRNPAIRDHPDVSPLTLNTCVMAINMFFNNLDLSPGIRHIDQFQL